MTPNEELTHLLDKLDKAIRDLRINFLTVDDFQRTMKLFETRPLPFVDRDGLHSYAIERVRKAVDAMTKAQEAFRELEL